MSLAQIAELLRISKSAVSMALNGKPGVSDATRAAVLRTARELGYTHRSMVAQAPRKSVRVLACTEGDIVSAGFARTPFFLELVGHIQDMASLTGYACIVSAVPLENYAQELARIETSIPSAGLLLLGTNLSTRQMIAIGEGRRNLVVVDAFDELLPFNTVVMNNRQGAAAAVRHLLELGHRRIGYGRCSARVLNFEARERGFVETLAAQGIGVRPEDCFLLPPSIEDAQAQFAAAVGSRGGDLPSAIFCDNDYLAIGVIKAATSLGMLVPESLSVIGFDDIPEAKVVAPELTTIHVAKDQIARVAVERLCALIEDNDQAVLKQIIDTQLVTRASTAPPGE